MTLGSSSSNSSRHGTPLPRRVDATRDVVHASSLPHDNAAESDRSDDDRRRCQSRFTWLVEHAIIGIYRSTLDGRFLEVNPALVSMLGYSSREELLSVPVLALYRDPRDRRTLLHRFRYASDVKDVEAEWRRKDGRTIVVRLNGRWVSDDDQPEGFEMFVEDVSERRALEDRLHRAQQLEAVGRAATDLAPEFSRLMTAVLGHADLLAPRVAGDAAARADLAEITRAAERAFTLWRQVSGQEQAAP